MKSLIDIFAARDVAFDKETDNIFAIIENSLAASAEFLFDINPVYNTGIITWEDVNLVDDLIVLICVVQYSVGDTIPVDGEDILITDENLEFFQKVIHMNLPIAMAIENDFDVILNFLYEMYDGNQLEAFDESIDPPPADVSDFDLEQLTEKQRIALLLLHTDISKDN